MLPTSSRICNALSAEARSEHMRLVLSANSLSLSSLPKRQIPFTLVQGGLAATFDLAAFGLYMIAPVKKSVNHSKTLTSMREVQRGDSIAFSFPEPTICSVSGGIVGLWYQPLPDVVKFTTSPCIRQLRPRYERQSKPWCPVSVLGYGSECYN